MATNVHIKIACSDFLVALFLAGARATLPFCGLKYIKFCLQLNKCLT